MYSPLLTRKKGTRLTTLSIFISVWLLALALLLVSRLAAAASPVTQVIPANLAPDDWNAIQGLLATQTGYLKAANAEAADRFGHSVAIDSNMVVVGAHLEDSNGSAPSDNSASNAGALYSFMLGPVPTNTPTTTPTNTPTITSTNTPTDTPTITSTNTPTDTPTITSTNTPTTTPGLTLTNKTYLPFVRSHK